MCILTFILTRIIFFSNEFFYNYYNTVIKKKGSFCLEVYPGPPIGTACYESPKINFVRLMSHMTNVAHGKCHTWQMSHMTNVVLSITILWQSDNFHSRAGFLLTNQGELLKTNHNAENAFVAKNCQNTWSNKKIFFAVCDVRSHFCPTVVTCLPTSVVKLTRANYEYILD